MATIDRSKEITRLYDLVMTRENIFLWAPSGMGKTYLLNELFQKLEGRRICFYLSVRGFTSNEQFLLQLSQSIKSSASRYSNVDYQLRRFFDENPLPAHTDAEAINSWLENLLVALQNISQDFLFVIEDLNQWEGVTPIDHLLIKFLGSRNSHLLITGRHTTTVPEGFSSFELQPLVSGNITIETSPQGEEVIDQLLKYTRGNTAFFMNILKNQNPEELNISESIKRVMAIRHSTFYTFRNRFTDLQWRLLKAIAYEEKVLQPHAFDFLMKYRLGAASSVERALKNLAESAMIEKTRQGWQIENVELQAWLRWLYANRL